MNKPKQLVLSATPTDMDINGFTVTSQAMNTIFGPAPVTITYRELPNYTDIGQAFFDAHTKMRQLVATGDFNAAKWHQAQLDTNSVLRDKLESLGFNIGCIDWTIPEE